MKKSDLPKISIVTPSYNQGKFLRETIESILNQDYPNLEYFIIDGGSTDNSVEIIREYEDRITWWVSEKDNGQSDALNKGFSRAQSHFLTWVNSDDLLLPGALRKVGEFIIQNPQVRWISGNSIWIDAEGRIIRFANLPGCNRFLASMGLLVIGGPSTLFSNGLYRKAGKFKENLFFTMDCDMWWRFYKSGVCFKHIPEYLMAYRLHEGSKCSASLFDFEDGRKGKNMLTREKRKKEESDMLIDKYGKRHLLFLAKKLHNCRQLINGNYIKAWLNLKRMRGKEWKQVFSVEQENKK
jgi:glycosyltransferase involved in cell wall biosynthesis